MAKRPEQPPSDPPTVRIASRVEGLYCCGVAHSVAPRDFPAWHFTAAQIAEMEAHPDLTLTRAVPAEG